MQPNLSQGCLLARVTAACLLQHSKAQSRNVEETGEAVAEEMGTATNRCHSLPVEGGFVPRKPIFKLLKRNHMSCGSSHALVTISFSISFFHSLSIYL